MIAKQLSWRALVHRDTFVDMSKSEYRIHVTQDVHVL